MFFNKNYTVKAFLLCFSYLSLVQATIIDINVLQLGNDVIILNGDQHRFDDSQEIWQATALLLAETEKPANLVLVEKNEVGDAINAIPDDSDNPLPQVSHISWTKQLISLLQTKSQLSSAECLQNLYLSLLQTTPEHNSSLSLLDLFYDSYDFLASQPSNTTLVKPVASDQRKASILTLSIARDYFPLFADEQGQWKAEKNIPNLIPLAQRIIDDLETMSQNPLMQIPFANFYQEESLIDGLVQSFKQIMNTNPDFIKKLTEIRKSSVTNRANVLKALAYFYELNLLENISFDELQSRFKEIPFNLTEALVIQKIYYQTIPSILKEGIINQTKYLIQQLKLPQTPQQQEKIASFLKKRTSLLVILDFDSLTSGASMIELFSLCNILKCVSEPHSQPKKIMVLGGVEHMLELAEMLKIFGAKPINNSNIFENAGKEPETSTEAFEICSPINNKLLLFNSL